MKRKTQSKATTPRKADQSRLNRIAIWMEHRRANPPTPRGPDCTVQARAIASEIQQAIIDNEGFGGWLWQAAERVFPGGNFPTDDEVFGRLLGNDLPGKTGAMAFLLACCHDDMLREFQVFDWERYQPGYMNDARKDHRCVYYRIGTNLRMYLTVLLRDFQKTAGTQDSKPIRAEQSGPEAKIDSMPSDLKPLKEVLKHYWTTATTLKRQISEGLLTDYRKPGKKNHVVSLAEVAKYHERKPQEK